MHIIYIIRIFYVITQLYVLKSSYLDAKEIVHDAVNINIAFKFYLNFSS